MKKTKSFFGLFLAISALAPLDTATAAGLWGLGKTSKTAKNSASGQTAKSVELDELLDIVDRHGLNSMISTDFLKNMIKTFRKHPDKVAAELISQIIEHKRQITDFNYISNIYGKAVSAETEVFWKIFDIDNIKMREAVFDKWFFSNSQGPFFRRLDFFAQNNTPLEKIGAGVLSMTLKMPLQSKLGELNNWNVEQWNEINIHRLFTNLNARGVTLGHIISNPDLSFSQANLRTLENFMREIFWKLDSKNFEYPVGKTILPYYSVAVDEETAGLFIAKLWPRIEHIKKGFLGENRWGSKIRSILKKTIQDRIAAANSAKTESLYHNDPFIKAALIAADREPRFSEFFYQSVEEVRETL